MKPKFRASELDRVLSCNGSITLVPLVAPREGDEGFEGEVLHYLIAARLVRELGAIEPEGGLKAPACLDAGYVLPASSLWFVDWCVRHVMERVPPDWTLLVEMESSTEYERWINTGHRDVTAISPDAKHFIGLDWKSGRDPVDPADNNEQVGSYIALAKEEWPTIERAEFDVVQPRLSEEDGDRVSPAVLEGDRLERLSATLDARVCAAMDNALELNSSKKACRWCPVGIQCPALQAEQNHMKLTLTPAQIAAVKLQPDDALLGDWVVAMRTLKRPTEDAEELLHKRLDAQPVVIAGDGTQITRKITRGSYEIPDPSEFVARVWRYFFGDIAPTEAKIVGQIFKPSMTNLKDVIAERRGLKKTSKSGISAETEFDTEFRPLVKQGEKRTLQFL